MNDTNKSDKNVSFIWVLILNLLDYIKQRILINLDSEEEWFVENDTICLNCYDVSQFFSKIKLNNLKDAQLLRTRQYVPNIIVLFIFY